MGNEKQPAPQDLRERANEMFEDYMNREYGEAWEIVDATVIDALRDLWNYLKQPPVTQGLVESIVQAITDPENQPNQYGITLQPQSAPQDLRERAEKFWMQKNSEPKFIHPVDVMLQFASEQTEPLKQRIAELENDLKYFGKG